MRRLSPSLVVAVLALVLAAGGVGFAAGQITSGQIRDNTIQSRDVRNNALTGRDVQNRSLTGDDVRTGSLPRTSLSKACGAGRARAFGGCVRLTATGPSSYQAAIDDCNRRNGRLPTTAELRWVAAHDEYTWADDDVSQYEFSGDDTGDFPFTPIAFDAAGNAVTNASGQLFWHRCVETY